MLYYRIIGSAGISYSLLMSSYELQTRDSEGLFSVNEL
jgi:hypothetical protein